ncbi:MAG: hypothetical protein CMH60_03920 [Myxococcales bacterium]|nr:hypothetical protein [Myxococcales bacterium]
MNAALYTPKTERGFIALILSILLSACGQGYIINDTQSAELPENNEPEHVNESMTTSKAPANQTGQVSVPTVVELGDCPVNVSTNGTLECKRLAVSCGGYDQTEVRVRIHSPNTRIAPAGTIIFGSGGTGTNWVYNPGNPDNKIHTAMNRLLDGGYTLVERAWADGWWGVGQAGDGLVGPACRYIELAKWIKGNIHSQGGFCAMGNSGGSSEIAYGLTHWNGDAVFDFTLLSGGPPMGNIAKGCFPNQVPNWKNQCLNLWNQYGHADACGRLDIDPIVMNDPNYSGPVVASDSACGYASAQSAEFDAAFATPNQPSICSTQTPGTSTYLAHESVLSPNAVYDYPSTDMHFIFGTADCTEAALLGKLYVKKITSQRTMEHLDGVVHSIWKDLHGAKRAQQILKNRCH